MINLKIVLSTLAILLSLSAATYILTEDARGPDVSVADNPSDEKQQLPAGLNGQTTNSMTKHSGAARARKDKGAGIHESSAESGIENEIGTPNYSNNDAQPVPPLEASYTGESTWRQGLGIAQKDIPDKYKGHPEKFDQLLKQRLDGDISKDQKQSLEPVIFTTSTPEAGGQIYQAEMFSSGCTRVYAVFSSESDVMKGRNAVLVKWYDVAGRVELFQYLPINNIARINYIWREKAYWEEGTYSVDVFELENEVRPLASGSYTITRMDEYVGYLSLHGDYTSATSRNIFSSNEGINLQFNYSSKWPTSLPVKVYYKGTNNFIYENAVQLDSSNESTYYGKIKYTEDVWPIGAYEIMVLGGQEQIINRTIFYIE